MMSRSKGARGEREFRDLLISMGVPARRGQQYAGGLDSPDVVTDLDAVAHFEVKRTERLDLRSSMAQAIHDTGSAIGCHPMPIVVQRGSHQEWLAIMRAEDCITMLKKIAQPPSEG